MMLTQQQLDALNGIRGIAPTWAKLWNDTVQGEPGKVGVPYSLSDNFTEQQKQKILDGMLEIEDNTCIKYIKCVKQTGYT